MKADPIKDTDDLIFALNEVRGYIERLHGINWESQRLGEAMEFIRKQEQTK
jgi:hypothetical protein